MSFTNKVFKMGCPTFPVLSVHPYTVPSWPFVMQSSVAEFALIMTGMPMHIDSRPGIFLSFMDGA